jgi:hypothetical protein
MQRVLPCLLLAAACGGTEPADNPGVDAMPVTRGFQVVSPDITIQPGEEITYCYYFRTPNTEDMVIKRWASEMTPGSHHLIYYTTASDTMPPGTVSSSGCGAFGGGNLPSWTYAAQVPSAAVALPTDDGNGLPLGQDIKAGTPGYFQMHYLNTTDEPIQAHVTLTAEAYDAGTAYTKTAAFITYNSQISIDPGATGDIETQTCSTPAGAKFWMLSTHAHKQAVRTTIKDATTVVFNSDDWEHPGAKLWTTPYHTFASGKLTYECEYNNTGDNVGSTVVSGPSADTNEMCMATGYYFPATKSLICLNSFNPF